MILHSAFSQGIYTKDNTLKTKIKSMVVKLLNGDNPNAAFPSVVVVAAAALELDVLDASVVVVVAEVVSAEVNTELDVTSDEPGVVLRGRVLVDVGVLSRQDALREESEANTASA
ncbi:unnamed protein product [Clonostachys rosea]|uniref:Uncharacterized protein n=1 Tax=Bionectria ochroleuca TaxID=29856 RepID=A0ABY6U8K7_BIOOC|nr:unnamed protein product [Clonostachys rosea]